MDNFALDEIYQEVILSHYKNPKNYGTLENADINEEGHNPMCGDEITITANIENDNIKNISFKGSGCAISQASASLLTDKIKGKTIDEFKTMFKEFSEILKGDNKELSLDHKKFGNIIALQGVSAFPARVKCALLAWHALNTGIIKKNTQDDDKKSIS